MTSAAGYLVGFLALTAAGAWVSTLVKFAATPPDRPEGIADVLWDELTKRARGGDVLGFLERTFLFVVLAANMVGLAAAWFAFKLASKWEVWKNVIRLPERPRDGESESWYAFTHAFGSWVLQRFWIGTLTNALLAAGAVMAAKHLPTLLRWCS